MEERREEKKGMEKTLVGHIIKLNNGPAIKNNVHLPNERVSDT
jgi:hypothetical protein